MALPAMENLCVRTWITEGVGERVEPNEAFFFIGEFCGHRFRQKHVSQHPIPSHQPAFLIVRARVFLLHEVSFAILTSLILASIFASTDARSR